VTRSATIKSRAAASRLRGRSHWLERRVRLLLFGTPRIYSAVRRAHQLLRYFRRRPHEADFAAFAHFRDRNGLFLDVGASSGTSALSFRVFDRRRPILSIEPNPLHAPELRLVGRIVGSFKYLIGAAGDRNEDATLCVPTYRGVPITGAAWLDRDGATQHWYLRRTLLGERMDSPEFEVVAQAVRVYRLDDLELHPACIKIDVEGEELAVVRGLAQTIARELPVLMIEYSRGYPEIAALLARHGYEAYTYLPDGDRFVPFSERKSPNVFFLPPGVARREIAQPPEGGPAREGLALMQAQSTVAEDPARQVL
jgi:FkbM family methyltransferase